MEIEEREREAAALVAEADDRANAGRYEEAVAAYDDVLARFGGTAGSSLRKRIAAAMAGKAAALMNLGRDGEATAAVEALRVRLVDSNPDLASLQAQVLTANKRIAALSATGRHEEAVNASEALVAVLSADAPVRPSIAIAVLRIRARALFEAGRVDDAIGLLDEAVKRYGSPADGTVRGSISAIQVDRARWLDFKAATLLRDDSYEGVVSTADELLRGVAAPEESRISFYLAHGSVKKALALGRLGQLQGVLDTVEEADERFGAVRDPEVRAAIARLLDLKALALRKLGELARAAAVWGQLAERYGGDDSPETLGLVERALTQRAEVLTAIGQPAEAIAIADAVLSRSHDESGPTPQARIADALLAKGAALVDEERNEEAIAALDEVIKHFECAPELRRQVTLALLNKVSALESLGRDEESAGVLEEMLTRFGVEAVALFQETVDQLADTLEPAGRTSLAAALYGKASALGKLHRRDEALGTLGELVTRFEADRDPVLQDFVREARKATAQLLDADPDEE